MSSYGIKVSKPGFDVQTCNVKDCSLHSDYTAFKNRLIGSISLTANTTTTISHNFGYVPNYCGWYTGSFYDLTGIKPFGYNVGSSSLISWADETNLYLKSSINTTAYYYIQAELGGQAPTTPPALPDYGEFGLMVCQEGTDIISAQPYQLNFLSTYPNFKVYEERTADGFSIPILNGTANLNSSQTTISFTDANKYGLRGKLMIAGYQMIPYYSWHWCLAEFPSIGTIVDDSISDYGVSMTVKYNSGGGSVSGSWTPGSGFQGDVRWTGNDPIVFEYYLDGSWQQITTANSWVFDWNTLSGTEIKNWKRNDNQRWLECYKYYAGDPVCNAYVGNSYQEYKEEIVTFTSSNSTGFSGITRGVDSSGAKEWKVGDGGYSWYRIAPIQILKPIGANPFSYNPAFFSWGLSPFDVTFFSISDVILSSNTFYLCDYRAWGGSSDYWLISNPLPYNPYGVYYKIMYDELGT